MTSTAVAAEEFNMTELGPLPSEWKVARLSDYCSFVRGTEPGSNSYNRLGKGTVFIRVGNIAAGIQDLVFTTSSNVRMCAREDILMTFDGSPGVVVRGCSGAYSSGIRKILPLSAETDKDFLYYVLQTQYVQRIVDEYRTGVTIKHAGKALPHIVIPLPPLPEQKKIAYFLSTVQAAIEKTEAVIKAARALKKSLMRHFFTYGPVPISEAEQVPLKETEIGPVPEHWQQTELGQIADIVYGVQAAVANLTDSSIGIPILTNINVRNDGMLDISTLRYYPLPENKRHKLILKKGDVLFNWRSGSPLHVGKTAIFNLDGDYTFSSFILRFRSCSDSTNNEYLFRYLNLLKSSGFFLSKRSQSSVNSVFNASLAAKIPILLPPMLDQIKISSMLSSADRKIEAEEDSKKALEALFKTLLTRFMNGKIRVKNLEVPV